MNWITKFIKPKIKSLFKKKSSKVEENLWTTCGCKNLIYKEDLDLNLKCCPKCGSHHKLSCKERFETFFDNKEYELIKTPLPNDDPLKFEDNKISAFEEKLDSAGQGFVNSGLYYLLPEIFDGFEVGSSFSIESEVFPRLVSGRQLGVVKLNESFIDIGIPEDYLKFCNWVELGRVHGL